MAERLTEYFECGAYTSKENIIDVSDKVKFFDNGCVMGKAIDKLAQLEDIMEEHDFNNIEDLQGFLNFAEKAIKEYRQVRFDRDNWQKACELACETLKQVMGKPLWIGGNIPAPEVKDSEYFYQQAKKEKDGDNNDTNQ